MSIADIRREYSLASLRRRDLAEDPIVQFKRWFEQVEGKRASGWLLKLLTRIGKSLMQVTGAEPMDENAMILATADKDGRPAGRVVLLKGVDQRGFIFYTNYDSRKGRELEENPQAALVFYWSNLERQVCIAGTVSKLPAAESEAYHNSRPRGSRIGAWASEQSSVVRDRAELETHWSDFEARYPGSDVPKPPNWGGYVLAPARVEFWQGRPNRLHDRFRYTRQPDGTWLIERLSP